MPSFHSTRSPALNDSSSSYTSSNTSSDISVSTVHTGLSDYPWVEQYHGASNVETGSGWERPQHSQQVYSYPRSSTETHTSTAPSFVDSDDHLPPFDVPEDQWELSFSTATPSTPQEFADFFPSTRKLSIRHDDATDDGNMNLRVDTEVRTSHGKIVDLTLFHLRMHDLKGREFSFRRYCRDSGREICHSTRTYTKPSVIRRPGFQRSMSSALSGLRSKSAEEKSFARESLKRQDSGYDSMSEDEPDRITTSPPSRDSNIPVPSNSIRLEFSNYAHFEIKRRGKKSSKRYDFEYWGTKYAWKRASIKSGTFKEISYHLIDTESSVSIAHIVPIPLSVSELREEEAKGGWVPPCSMWISDEDILRKSPDVADAIVASGLIALVDDSIKRKWHHKSRVEITLPVLSKSSRKMNSDHVGPKRLIDEVFHRGAKSGNGHLSPSLSS